LAHHQNTSYDSNVNSPSSQLVMDGGYSRTPF
jgi:hypothetical protein